MRKVNLSNEKGRDAQVGFEGRFPKGAVRQALPDGRTYRNVRLLKWTVETDLDALVARYGGLDQLSEALIRDDPEIDLERTGSYITGAKKLYLDADGRIAYNVSLVEVVKAPDGTERERRALKQTASNIAGEIPLRWTGKLMPKALAARRFVFSSKYQIRHVNGLTFDFLYDMAKKLHEAKALTLIGGGEKGTDPLVFATGGVAYRGFLEGRIDGERYCLILHLTNLELKEIPS